MRPLPLQMIPPMVLPLTFRLKIQSVRDVWPLNYVREQSTLMVVGLIMVHHLEGISNQVMVVKAVSWELRTFWKLKPCMVCNVF